TTSWSNSLLVITATSATQNQMERRLFLDTISMLLSQTPRTPYAPIACHWREPVLEPRQNRGPGRIQVQVQQRHDNHKHQPDHTSISHNASPPTTGLPGDDWCGQPVVDDRHSARL